MKICSPQLGLSPKSDLGGEVHDHFILQGLAQRGHKIFVYLPKGRPYQKNSNIEVLQAPYKHVLALTYNLLIIPYLFRIYKKEEFDILRVHNPYFVGVGSLFFKFFNPKVPVVTTYHLKESNFIFNLINRLTAKRYDGIITVSQFLKSWLIKTYGVKANKISVIYNGVSSELRPLSKNQILLKKYNLQNKFIILFMGLLNERKNPLFLLQVFKNLKQKHKNLSLILCGRGSLETQLKNFVHQNKLQDVYFIPPVFGKDKVDFFNLCDVFALPSKNEGFGLVVAEAMACAKPVIVSENSSLKEIIDDRENGLLAKTDDINDWTQKLSELVKNKNLREKIAASAHKKARSMFNWEKTIAAHQKLFKKLTND